MTTSTTVITLTLPASDDASHATLLIQRGELAHMCQFSYSSVADLADVLQAADAALAQLEAQPPTIPELPAEKPKRVKSTPKPPADDEPTVEVPLKRGTRTVKMRHIKIVGGESDAAAYRQALAIAGRLIDGGLWDGQSPIQLTQVYALAKRLRPLTDKELALFTLEDFVTREEQPHTT